MPGQMLRACPVDDTTDGVGSFLFSAYLKCSSIFFNDALPALPSRSRMEFLLCK